MTKSKLIQVLSDRLDLTRSQANLFLEVLFEVAVDTLKAEGTFVIPGVTKLVVKNKPASPERQGRNPATNEPITIAAKPATKDVKARVLQELKSSVIT